MAAVTSRPTTPAQNRFIGWISSPPEVSTAPGRSWLITHQTAPNDRTPVTISPWYRAPMMLPLLPRRTKKVPMIEVTMQTPQIASGSSISTST
ncbi:hypothetical protein D3C73_1471000 [compost metagenome]